MKKILILGAFAAALAMQAGAARSQVMLQKAVISSGGNTSSNTTTQMEMGSTAGQPVVGVASNSQMRVEFGFWTPAAAASAVGPMATAPDFSIQAWPNPALDATKLTVTLGAPANLDLQLFDLTGKEVQNIYNGPASGSLALKLDLSSLPSGSYILAARIPGQLVEKKISVAR